LTYLVDLFHTAITGDGVYPPMVDSAVLLIVILIFTLGAKTIQQHNLHSGR
ncbi:MAG: ABC transporter, partial [Methanoregula sp.]